ncbi:MAG TPA: SDR family NAD(P)-dependent oxidoreductase [candidate division Zixibacteria bacterium]|nr:SDR family NAD(P)-dependent oxidoreductase [candidate division Zixibacteria bacterium]
MTTAMIWGAGSGIGKALTSQLLADEWEIIAVGRNVEQFNNQATMTIEADVTNTYSVQNAIRSAGNEIDQITLWINAFGDLFSSTVNEISPECWQQLLGSNLTSTFLVTHFSLPILKEDASLIFIGAMSERLPLPGLSAYAWAKSGLEDFVETMRKEERKRRVSLVHPGVVDTPFLDKLPFRMPKDAATPEQIADRIMSAYHDGYKGVIDLS